MPILVCPNCGEWQPEKIVTPTSDGWAEAACPACGARHPFGYLPLRVVTGPSGAGKTSIVMRLMDQLEGYVVLETDVLWGSIPEDGGGGWTTYWNAWLRLAMSLHQNGLPVVLCGTVMPDALESSPFRRYFPEIRYLALVAEPDALVQRLKARPAWRKSADSAFLEQTVGFTTWLRERVDEGVWPMDLLDTSSGSPDDTARAVADWVRNGSLPAE